MLNLFRLFLPLIVLPGAIHVHAQKKDTIFLVREFFGDGDTENYHVIYIDTARKSPVYGELADFRFDEFDIDPFKRSVQYFRDQKLRLTKKNITGVPLKWVPVFLYKNKHYLYRPSDYYGYYRAWFTDTAFIDDYGEGATANKIVSYAKKDAKTTVLSLKSVENPDRNLIIHMVDKQTGIAVFEDTRGGDKRYYMMIDASKMKQLPIIVNYCKTSRANEFDFDEPDYEKLIREK